MATVVYKWLVLWSFSMMGTSLPMERNATHPLYVSVTEINHNAGEKSLEISVKVFSEDLQQVIEKNNKVQLDLTAEKDKAKTGQYITAYFNNNLSLIVDGRSVALSYVGFEVEKESAFCYFEVKNMPSL